MNGSKGMVVVLLAMAAAMALWLRGCLADIEHEELDPPEQNSNMEGAV